MSAIRCYVTTHGLLNATQNQLRHCSQPECKIHPTRDEIMLSKAAGLTLLLAIGLIIAGCSMFGPTGQDQTIGETLSDEIDGYQTWGTVPGFEEWEVGTSVHGDYVKYFINATASNNLRELPSGSIIVKEGYSRDRELKAVTVMKRIEGFDPEAGDWFWARYTPDGSLTHAGGSTGGTASCVDCHSKASGGDYSFANDGL